MLRSKKNFREIDKENFPIFGKVIRDIWQYERFCSSKTAEHIPEFDAEMVFCLYEYIRKGEGPK